MRGFACLHPTRIEKMNIKLLSVDGKPILCQNHLLLNVIVRLKIFDVRT